MLIDRGWGAAGLAVEAIAEGAAGESLFVLCMGFGSVMRSRGMEPDGAVTLHTANGYVGELAGLLDGDDFPLRDCSARGIRHPRSHFALIDFLQEICLPPEERPTFCKPRKR